MIFCNFSDSSTRPSLWIGYFDPVETLIGKRTGAFERFEVSENFTAFDRIANFRLDALEQLMASLHRPVARHQHVEETKERAPARRVRRA